MKYVYYGFGGFIGFICGFVIQLIVFMVEKSGNRILTQLGRGDYGVIGQGLLALYQALPYLGIVLGVVMVRLIFKKEIENQASGKKKDAADPPGK
ncbi:MAG: hypothetical protein GWM98_19310 [Nitrospinaceae bacterium]|nr:hypothetical protein [Nitrospinaceae bacterium]NIR56237.1 hypothetical protein [Nitrospinaceae bacterium]NIT83526.1 hypothetical protein [Nitrospinaceae bacterium]NIU45731.1 hypothetical protein [Nitrospinaceae bacterium]NIW07307.1 hypothetical protein [Nitrospinaceae bacterium]